MVRRIFFFFFFIDLELVHMVWLSLVLSVVTVIVRDLRY